MSPKRASSKASTFSGFPRWRSRFRRTVSAKLFESLPPLGVGLLVAGTTRLELHLAAPQELADAVGTSVLDAMALSQEPVGLPDRRDPPFLHRLLRILEGLGRDQSSAAALAHPALQELLEPALPVAGEPPLALTPGVAQRPRRLPQVAALLGLQEPEHPDPLEEVGVTMALFELL